MAFTEFYEKIEDYIKGRLSEEEREAFDKEIASDPDLAEEVALHRDMIQATGEREILDFRSKMEKIGVQSLPPPSQNSAWKRWRITGFLTVVFLFAFGVVWWFNRASEAENPNEKPDQEEVPNQSAPPSAAPPTIPIAEGDEKESKPVQSGDQPKSQKKKESVPDPRFIAMANELYKQQPYEIILRNVPNAQGNVSLLQKAEEAYKNKNYPETINLLSKPVEGYVSESTKLRAHAYFRLGQFARAAEDFQSLTNGRYKYDAEWYLLLSYLPRLPETQKEVDALIGQITQVESHSFREKVLAVQGALASEKSSQD